MAIKLQICQIADLIDQGILEIGDGYRAKNDELEDTGLPFARGKHQQWFQLRES